MGKMKLKKAVALMTAVFTIVSSSNISFAGVGQSDGNDNTPADAVAVETDYSGAQLIDVKAPAGILQNGDLLVEHKVKADNLYGATQSEKINARNAIIEGIKAGKA